MTGAIVHVGVTAAGLMMLVAGASKALRLKEFTEAVRRYDLLWPRLVRPAGVTVVGVELLLGTLLVVRPGSSKFILAMACLVAVFSLAVGISLARGLHIPCGCSGTQQGSEISNKTLARNLVAIAVLLALAALAIQFPVESNDGLPVVIAAFFLLASIRLGATADAARRRLRRAASGDLLKSVPA